MADTKKQLRWYNVALIAFVSVWGLGNVFNNYAQQGLSVVTSSILIMAIYFVPYALIVGQLGSTFKDQAGGVSFRGSKKPVRSGSPIMLLGPIGLFIFHT